MMGRNLKATLRPCRLFTERKDQQNQTASTILAHWQVVKSSNLQTSNMSTMRNPADSSDSLSYRILTARILIHFDLILLSYVAYYNAARWMR